MKLCTVRRHKHWRSLSPRKQQRGSFAEGLGAQSPSPPGSHRQPRLPASTFLAIFSSPTPMSHLIYLSPLGTFHLPSPPLPKSLTHSSPPFSPPTTTAGRPCPPYLLLLQWPKALHRPPQQEGRRCCCCCCLCRPCPAGCRPPARAWRRVSDRCYGWGGPTCGQLAVGERSACPRPGKKRAKSLSYAEWGEETGSCYKSIGACYC